MLTLIHFRCPPPTSDRSSGDAQYLEPKGGQDPTILAPPSLDRTLYHHARGRRYERAVPRPLDSPYVTDCSRRRRTRGQPA